MAMNFTAIIDDPNPVQLTNEHIGPVLVRRGLTGPVSDTLPTSEQMASVATPMWGGDMYYIFIYHNPTDYPVTLMPGDDVMTLIGPMTVAANSSRTFSLSGNSDGANVTSLFSSACNV